MKFNKKSLLKWGGLACTVAGTIMTYFSNKFETEDVLRKLVDEKFKNRIEI